MDDVGGAVHDVEEVDVRDEGLLVRVKWHEGEEVEEREARGDAWCVHSQPRGAPIGVDDEIQPMASNSAWHARNSIKPGSGQGLMVCIDV